jgi:hypothetical protein
MTLEPCNDARGVETVPARFHLDDIGGEKVETAGAF